MKSNFIALVALALAGIALLATVASADLPAEYSASGVPSCTSKSTTLTGGKFTTGRIVYVATVDDLDAGHLDCYDVGEVVIVVESGDVYDAALITEIAGYLGYNGVVLKNLRGDKCKVSASNRDVDAPGRCYSDDGIANSLTIPGDTKADRL